MGDFTLTEIEGKKESRNPFFLSSLYPYSSLFPLLKLYVCTTGADLEISKGGVLFIVVVSWLLPTTPTFYCFLGQRGGGFFRTLRTIEEPPPPRSASVLLLQTCSILYIVLTLTSWFTVTPDPITSTRSSGGTDDFKPHNTSVLCCGSKESSTADIHHTVHRVRENTTINNCKKRCNNGLGLGLGLGLGHRARAIGKGLGLAGIFAYICKLAVSHSTCR